MNSLVVVEKNFVLDEEAEGTFVVFDVVEGEVEGALYIGEGDVMDAVNKVVIEYGHVFYGSALSKRSFNKTYEFLDGRIAELKASLVEEGVVFDEVEAMESAELLEAGSETLAGVCHVILTDVLFGNAKTDFNPRGLGYIEVVDEVSTDAIESGVRYKVVYTGTEASSTFVYRLLLCVGKRIEFEQMEESLRREFARFTSSLKQELSDVTGVSLETIESKLEAVTV